MTWCVNVSAKRETKNVNDVWRLRRGGNDAASLKVLNIIL